MTDLADKIDRLIEAARDAEFHLGRILSICETDASDKTKVRRIYRIAAQALAAGARSDETNEDLAQSEGRQSGGCKPQRPMTSSMTTLSSHKYSMKGYKNG